MHKRRAISSTETKQAVGFYSGLPLADCDPVLSLSQAWFKNQGNHQNMPGMLRTLSPYIFQLTALSVNQTETRALSNP